ncbi:rhomboid family intramembrane serine protease [Pseudonocardia sp. CA-107938]|uniref:rhomboid family intramembrane serine protease n=1 Tax=Pseudonocardia sp. CA-107938 TaxID=3240021 RepID=UPI003D89F4A7
MTAPVAPRRLNRVLPPHPVSAALTMLVFTAALYVVEVLDLASGGTLEREGGIVSREPDGLDGIVFSPLLHGSWDHLWANTVPFLIFGFLAMAGGIGQFVMITATIWVLGGAAVWAFGPDGVYTVGASGVIFGWLAFLLVRGFFARSVKQILLAVVLFLIWGGVLWGVLPTDPHVSWQAHLFGALAGVLAAWLVARADRPGARAH